MDIKELCSIFDTELKRGTLTLAILAQLHKPQYGYSLLQILTDQGVDVEAGTLYPMLRRLEKQGVLICDWDTSESRPRKYYRLSECGAELYAHLVKSWSRMAAQMEIWIGGNQNETH